MKRRVLVILGGAVVLAVVVTASVLSTGSSPLEVEVTPCEKGDVAPTVTADGLVSAKVAVNISSQVIGEIQRIPFKEGARVSKGDLLVQLNPDTYERDVASAEAYLRAAELAARQADVTLAQRQKDWERAQDLFGQKIYSQQQYDDAKLAVDHARLAADQSHSQAAQARAAFQRAQDYLGKTTLLSPIGGVVTAVNVKEGEQAMIGTMNNPGTVILTVSDLSEIITEVQVDEVDLPRLKIGQESQVTVDALGGKKYAGTVIEIGASAHAGQSGLQSNIRQFTVKVAITNPDADLRPGVTARVKLIAAKRAGVVRVPVGAIRTEEKQGELALSVLVAGDGKVARKPIETGLSDDQYTEVTKGLNAGEQVITGPYRLLRTLREGDRVKPKVAKNDVKKEGKGQSVD